MLESSRRGFLKLAATSIIALAGSASLQEVFAAQSLLSTPAATNLSTREFLMLCDTTVDVKDRNADGIRVSNSGWIKGLDVASGEQFSVDLPFFGHTVTQNPVQPRQVVTFEKWGTRGALADVLDQSVLNFVEPAPGNTFFGHAAFSFDGSKLFTTEDTYQASTGQLVIRNAGDLSLIDKLPSYGIKPHQCLTSEDGKTLIVVNQGLAPSPANVVWIDLFSGKLLNKVELVLDRNVGYSHCDISYDNWVCVGGVSAGKAKNIPCELVNFITPNGIPFSPRLPAGLVKKLHGEALSIAFIGHTGLVAVTVPAADILLIFNYKKNILVEALDMPKPTGIVPNNNNPLQCDGVLVSCKPDKNLMSVLKFTSGGSTVTVAKNDFGGLGAHLTRMYI